MKSPFKRTNISGSPLSFWAKGGGRFVDLLHRSTLLQDHPGVQLRKESGWFLWFMVDYGRYNYSSWGLQTNIGRKNIEKYKNDDLTWLNWLMVDIKRTSFHGGYKPTNIGGHHPAPSCSHYGMIPGMLSGVGFAEILSWWTLRYSHTKRLGFGWVSTKIQSIDLATRRWLFTSIN